MLSAPTAFLRFSWPIASLTPFPDLSVMDSRRAIPVLVGKYIFSRVSLFLYGAGLCVFGRFLLALPICLQESQYVHHEFHF